MGVTRMVVGLGVVLVMSTAGCMHDTVELNQTLWEASLVGAEAMPLATGVAAAISVRRRTEAGLSLESLDPGTYLWAIRAGTCATPGAGLGVATQFPELAVAAEGTATVDGAIISDRMDSGHAYHVAVLISDGPLVACGDFQEIP